MRNFVIKSEGFEGPFDKILELIEKKKLSINQISLSKITDEYVEFLKENEIKLKDTTKFIWVASVLLLLKSKSLLPTLTFSKEDDLELDELKKSLAVLAIYKEYSVEIKKRYGANASHKKIVKPVKEIKFSPDENINFKNLLLVLDNLISRTKIEEKIPEKKIGKQRSLKEITEEITNKIERYIKITFQELTLTKDKKEVSASFISVLELFRNNFVDLKQEKDFGEIIIEKTGPSEVLYKEV